MTSLAEGSMSSNEHVAMHMNLNGNNTASQGAVLPAAGGTDTIPLKYICMSQKVSTFNRCDNYYSAMHKSAKTQGVQSGLVPHI